MHSAKETEYVPGASLSLLLSCLTSRRGLGRRRGRSAMCRTVRGSVHFHLMAGNTHLGLLQLLWWCERGLRLRCCSLFCRECRTAFWQCGALRLYEEVYTFMWWRANTHLGLLQLLWWCESGLRLRRTAYWQCSALRLYEEVYTFMW